MGEMRDTLPESSAKNIPARRTRTAKSRKPKAPQATSNLPTTPPADWNNFKSNEILDPSQFSLSTNAAFSTASPSVFSHIRPSSNDTSGCQTPTQKGFSNGSPPDLLNFSFSKYLPPVLTVNSSYSLELRNKLEENDVSYEVNVIDPQFQ